MIDWIGLATNALWIVGLAVALATLSFANWKASVDNRKLRKLLGEYPFSGTLYFAAVLFCLGLATTADALWETGIWLLFTIYFAYCLLATVIRRAPPFRQSRTKNH